MDGKNSELEPALPTVHIAAPTKEVCPICAAYHHPDYPHNWHSLYYQMRFRQDHGRFATRDDAIAHCPKAVRDTLPEEPYEGRDQPGYAPE